MSQKPSPQLWLQQAGLCSDGVCVGGLMSQYPLHPLRNNPVLHCVALVSYCREAWLAAGVWHGPQRPKSRAVLNFRRRVSLNKIHSCAMGWGGSYWKLNCSLTRQICTHMPSCKLFTKSTWYYSCCWSWCSHFVQLYLLVHTYHMCWYLLHLGGRRPRSGVELVYEKTWESVEFHQVYGLLEVFFCLTRETTDDVRGDGYTRYSKREAERKI